MRWNLARRPSPVFFIYASIGMADYVKARSIAEISLAASEADGPT